MRQTSEAFEAATSPDRTHGSAVARAPAATGVVPGTWARAGTLHAVPALLVLAFFVPIQFDVAGLRLSFYRMVMLLAFVPMLLQLAATVDLRLRAPDILMILAATSGGLSLAVTGSSVATVGIFMLETATPYFIARAYLRDAAAFGAMVRLFSGAVIATMLFAAYESFTGVPILIRILDTVFTVLPNVPHEMRFGLDRAQLTFDHPILYGMFSAMAFSLAFYTARLDRDGRMAWIRAGLVTAAVFFSLSSGAWVAVGLQIGLIAYDRVLRASSARWWIFFWGSVTLYVALEALSNRSMPEIMIGYLALNPGTAWTRIMVNEWAWGAVMAHPLFGLGFNWSWPVDWWLPTTSIDNFWIALAFRQGLPLMLLLLAAVASLLYLMARARSDGPAFDACRTGLAITIVALCVAVYTVHMWNSTYCMFLFLLGCGGWIIDRGTTTTAETGSDAPDTRPAGGNPVWTAPAARVATASPTEGEEIRRKLRFSRFSDPGTGPSVAGASSDQPPFPASRKE